MWNSIKDNYRYPKTKDALTVTSSKYEVDSQGGNIVVEVKANVEYEVDIKSEWIKLIGNNNTRSLTESNLRFSISTNDTGEKREGEIVIKSNNLSETVKVYQSFEDYIVLTQSNYTLPEQGGHIDIELKSTIEYGLKILSNSDWLKEAQTKSVSTHTHHYDILPNESYDSREAKIVFYSLSNENISDTVSIYQMYKGAILVARNEYQIKAKGDILNFQIETNLDFDIEISENWIIQNKDTRGLNKYELSFTISENTSEEEREGTIIIKDKNSDKQQVILIKQGFKDILKEALIALYNATNGDNWINNDNWCSVKPVSEWYGINVLSPTYITIDLGNNNLAGSLPKEIGQITYLRQLNLCGNQLSGEIPKELGNLQYLTNIHLDNNQLSGKIPDEIWRMQNLNWLSLSNNQFSEKISSVIKEAQKLTQLDIAMLNISELPEEIGELKNLKNLI